MDNTVRSMAGRLGQILRRTGVVDAAALSEALHWHMATGVRVGSALIQIQAARLDDIAHALSTQHGLTCPEYDELANVDPDVLARVPAALCVKHAVLPFRCDDGVVYVAMRDPHRRVAGELSYAIGAPVKRFVVPELRMMYLLEHHFGHAREPRFLRVASKPADEGERRKHVSATISADAGLELDLDQNPTEESLPVVAVSSGGPSRAAEVPPPGEPVEAARAVDVVLGQLADAENSEAIVRLMVNPVVEKTRISLLFFVHGTHAVACCASGIDTTPHRLQRLVVDLEPTSLMQWAYKMYSVVRGMPDPLQREIAKFFDVPPPGDVCVAPVVLGKKVANLICIWTAPGDNFGDEAVGILGELAQGGAVAYVELGRRLLG